MSSIADRLACLTDRSQPVASGNDLVFWSALGVFGAVMIAAAACGLWPADQALAQTLFVSP
jgi:hypothetical protein